MPPPPLLPIEDYSHHQQHRHHDRKEQDTIYSSDQHRSKLTSLKRDDTTPSDAHQDTSMMSTVTAEGDDAPDDTAAAAAAAAPDIEGNQDPRTTTSHNAIDHRGRSSSPSSHNSMLHSQNKAESNASSSYPISISSTEERFPPPSSSDSPSSSPDNEAPLSMSDDSSSIPSVSPPADIDQPQSQQQIQSHRPTAPRLARVSSDPVHTASTSTTPLDGRHLFQREPAPLPLPSGNRPAGVPLPSHMRYSPSNPPQAGPSNPTSTSAATTSRSTRYADPDSHWLSEDEGESFIDDLAHNRQSPRRRGGPRLHSHYPASSFDGRHDEDNDDFDGHAGGGGKNSAAAPSDGGALERHKRRSRQHSRHQQQEQDFFVDSSVAVQVPPASIPSPTVTAEVQTATSKDQRHHQQQQQHRSFVDARRSPKASESASTSAQAKRHIEASATYRDYAPFIKDLSMITPSLLKALTCPSCHKLMSDPTTLSCGHSECLTCVAPKAASVLLRKTSPTSPPIAITAAVLTTDEGNRFQDINPPPSPPVEVEDPTLGSAASITTPPRSPRAALADGVCPVSSCRKVTKATSNGRQGLRVDVVLQKLAILLKNRIASLEEADAAEDQMQESDFSMRSGSVHAPTPTRRSPPISMLDTVDLEDEEEGCRSEPLYRSSHSPSPGLSRSRSYRRHYSPPALDSSAAGAADHGRRDGGPSNTSSPDEETKSEDNAKRSMKSKTHSKAGRSIKKSRGSKSGISADRALRQQHQKYQAGMPVFVADVLSELECHICVTLIYEPLTTPCGHTFCKKCLLRSLDHSNRCPLCRSELPRMSYFISSPLNLTLSNALITTFPVLYEQRQILSKQEETESGLDTPIFVCMVSFPAMPTNLHIYEPKYRLMMRRALESNKRFGMVLPSRQPGSGGFAQYGTMLEIRNMHTFDDGRSMVETVGVSRFKILQSGTMDGYTVAQIERIDDIGDEEEAELERLALERSHARTQNERNAATGSASAPVRSPSQVSNNNNEKAAASPNTVSTEGHLPASAPTSRPATGLRRFSLSRNRSNSSASRGNPSNPASSTSASASPSSPSSNQSVDPAAGTASGNPNDASASDSMELTNAQLVEVCKGFVEALRTGSTPWLLQRLNSSLPPMPEDPREFTWWMAMLMPIDDHEKARLLQITSYRLRLRLLVFWIQQMQHSWWFNRGCTIC
ncbi:hypothetical protein P389DRAFT_192728 [Cystobasidium minutum MCA 4210]|uniref:uncharacterized protein n=1 Tax=Cystobasidium minutum MCA 4210 TaxID=1397322 RepID=UPI0034CD1651|eukprot:jgi/Rhomi1/192728/gm1.942_g